MKEYKIGIDEAKKEVSMALLYFYELAVRENPEEPENSKIGARLSEIKRVIEAYKGKEINAGTIWKVLKSKYFEARGTGRPIYYPSDKGWEKINEMLKYIEIDGKNLKEIWEERNKEEKIWLLDIVFEYKDKEEIEKGEGKEMDEFLELIIAAKELEKDGKDADAYKMYEKASQIAPLNSEILYRKAIILGRHNLLEDALIKMENYRKLYEKEMRKEETELKKILEKEKVEEENDLEKLVKNGRMEEVKKIYMELYEFLKNNEDKKLRTLAPLAKRIVKELEVID